MGNKTSINGVVDDQKVDQWSAAYHGNYQWLVDNLDNTKINKKDNAGRTALYSAAKKGHLNIVIHLVLKGADINCVCSSGSTPLHAASYCGKGTVVQFLVGYGCRRDIKNSLGKTAADEAKNNQIKQMILHPTRGNTERFAVKKRDLPAFLSDTYSVEYGGNALGFGNCSRINLIKEMKKTHKSYASQLQDIINADDITWNTKLIYLYTLESPLYKKMNADLAAINKLSECRIYANCLAKALMNSSLPLWEKVCYRSVYLNNDQIKTFKKHNDRYVRLPAFSSCTKSKQVALKWGGNALLIIHPPSKYCYGDYSALPAVDISSLSQFPHEQEVLLSWSKQMRINSVKLAKNNSIKYVIGVTITNVGP